MIYANRKGEIVPIVFSNDGRAGQNFRILLRILAWGMRNC